MRILLGLFLMCLIATPALPGEPIRATGVGRANPRFTGAQARLMAERGAQVDAARQLLAKSNPHSVRRVPGSNRVAIQGHLRGHQYRPTHFLPDGSARVVAEIPVNPNRQPSYPHP